MHKRISDSCDSGFIGYFRPVYLRGETCLLTMSTQSIEIMRILYRGRRGKMGMWGKMARNWNTVFNPRTAGGRLSAPPPPLRFFADSVKTAARSAAKFAIAV